MRKLFRYQFAGAGVLIGILFWFLEAIIHAYVFRMHPLRLELLPLDDLNELWMRSLVSFGFMACGFVSQWMMNQIFDEKLEIERINRELQSALDEIKTLKGILPICSSCKDIRDANGEWHRMEAYIRDRSDAQFSHGICPTCAKKLYPEFH